MAETNDLTKTTNELTQVLRSLTTGEEKLEMRHKPYVYGLLTGKQVSTTRSMSSDPELSHRHPLYIGTPWQRSVGDARIVGVDITNSTGKHVFDLHLVVTIPFRDFQHDSKFFPIDEKYATVLQSSEPPSKKLCLEDHADSTDARGLKPDQSAILTIAISSKLLGHRSELKLNVAVASKRKDGDKMTSSCIGLSPITVAMQDIFSEEPLNLNTKCKDKDALHDLAALNAYTNTNVKLVILSKETELTGILNLLQNRASMTYHPFLDILFWKTAQHLCLNNVWLTLIKSHRFEAHITVHARNRSQFFEVMHYLYGKLPADILILPDDGVPPKTLSSSLLDEANLVSSYLGNVGGAERDQSQSSGGPCQTNSLDLNGYRDFRRKLFKLEQETDAIAASVINLKHAQSS